MRRITISLVSLLLTAVTSSAQSGAASLLAELERMTCAKVSFVYTYGMPRQTSVSIPGVLELQGDSYRVETADGSVFCSDGKTLWHLYDGELVISNVRDGGSPYYNIKAFIERSSLSKNAAGHTVLKAEDERKATHSIEIMSMEQIASLPVSRFITDIDALGDDVYVNDLR